MSTAVTKVLTRDNISGGISSDKYLSVQNGCYDGEGLDIRRGKRVILNTHNVNNIVTLGNSSVATKINKDIIASNNGYIYNTSGVVLYKFEGNTAYGDIRQFAKQDINGVQYTYLIGTQKISRYVTASSVYSNLSVTISPLDTTRSDGGSGMLHVQGNTTPLTIHPGVGIVSGKRYRVNIVLSLLDQGSIVVNLGGSSTPVTLNANGTYTLFFTASTTADLTLTPTTDFDGYIIKDNILGLCNIEEGVLTLANYSSICNTLSDGGLLYIVNANNIVTINKEGTQDIPITLNLNTEIIKITKVGDQFLIWARETDNSSRVYYRNGIDENPSRSILRDGEIFQTISNMGNYHIVTTGGDFTVKKIWKTNGNNKELLHQIREGTRLYTSGNTLVPPLPLYWGGTASNYNQNNVVVVGDMIYLPGYNKIIGYGHKIPGFPDAFFPDFALKQTGISAMYYYDNNLFVAYSDKIIKWKLDNYESMQDTSNYYYFGDRGYLSFNPITFLASKEKKPSIYVCGNLTPTNTFINIYYTLDREVDRYTFVIDETINPVTVDPIVGDIYGNNGTSGEFIVTKITKYLNYIMLETQETVRNLTPRLGFELNKISGTGDSIITYVDFHNYRHLDIINNTNKVNLRQFVRTLQDTFNEIQMRVELITRDGKKSPEWNDDTLIYDEEPYV